MSVQKQRAWAIVGGGILGMTLAHRLAAAGQRVTLFEAANELGGLASAWRLGDVTWDRHYHVTLLSDTRLRALLTELGLGEEMRWVTTRTGFYVDNRLYSMSSTLEFLRFPPLNLLDKLRLGATILYASSIRDARKLEDIPVIEWLTRWSGRRVVDKIWRPLLRAKLGDNYRYASAAFLWAIIARMYAARRSGMKTEMFGYVPGGYARILARFAEQLADEGVEVRPLHRATQVQRSDGRLDICFDGRPKRTFDQVIVTAPSGVAARLCRGLSADEIARLEGIRYQGIVCASVVLARPLSGYYVTNITADWVPFTAVIEMTALVNPAETGGHTLIYLPRYVSADDAFFRLSDEEVRAVFVAALLRMCPHLSEGDVLHFAVSRVKYVLPISTLGYSRRLPRMSTSVPGLHIVNSTHIVNGTLNVNETIALGERASDELLSNATTVMDRKSDAASMATERDPP